MIRPNQMEVTVAAFLHDIGKLVQRAHGSRKNLPAGVLQFESDILPTTADGRPSHIHALGSEAFFQWMESEGLGFPGGLNRSTIRNLAVFHHKPDAVKREVGVAAWIIAESDRLASGQDRKEKDEAQESGTERGGWDAFIKTPMLSPFCDVMINAYEGPAPRRVLPLGPLSPGAAGIPVANGNVEGFPAEYGRLWRMLQDDVRALCTNDESGVFYEALLGISERLLHAVPSSTKDQPDVSLHDHARASAAIAGALYRWHEADGSLDDEVQIRDRKKCKFRFLVGDLSGIQSTLFLLARQQVKGVNKILRARSFLMSALVEAAALECERELALSAFSRLQNAGGRFVLLVPAVADGENLVDHLRERIERWMLNRWRGELGLNLSLTRAFSGAELQRDQFGKLQAIIGAAVEDSKQRPFSKAYVPVHRGDSYEKGVCTACGVRPALNGDGDAQRCEVCADEYRLGGDLPKLAAVTFRRQPTPDSDGSVRFWDDLRMCWHREVPALTAGIESGFRVWRGEETKAGKLPLRYLGNYVPRMGASERGKLAYRSLSTEAKEVAPEELKLFEHIATDALEERDGQLQGRALLGVLKADVDRLGAIFSQGLRQPSLGLIAGLSRRLDFFFTAYLPEVLRKDERFQSTYMVYAGGDDLLLIGPWRQMCSLLLELRKQFRCWTGESPQITISAALEITHQDEPLNRSTHAAEARLKRAKDAGRDRVCAVSDEPLTWAEYERELQRAETLRGYLESGWVSQAFVYRVLALDKSRLSIERYGKAGRYDPAWRAKWGYQLARNVRENKRLSKEQRAVLEEFLNGLVGLDAELAKREPAPSALTAITLAVYRNRNAD